MRRRNRAILSDIANLGLDPKKKYVKVNKAGNLTDESPKEKVVVQEQQKHQPKKVEAIVGTPVEKPIVVESVEVVEKEETSPVELEVVEQQIETGEELEATLKTEGSNKLPPFKKKKK